MSTIGVGGFLNGDPLPLRMYIVDLLDPSNSPIDLGPIDQEMTYDSPHHLHFTPDCGELVFHQTGDTANTGIWWFDIDGMPGPQLIGGASITFWADDDLTGLWTEPGPQQTQYKWLEVGEASTMDTLIDVPGKELMVVPFDGGTRLMIKTDELNGSVYMGDAFGPYEALLGAAAGENSVAGVQLATDGTHVLANYRQANNTYDVTLLEIVDNVILDATVTVAGSATSASWTSFATHAVVRFGNVDQPWLLEYAEPSSITALTGVLPPQKSGFSRAYSADGAYMLQSDDAVDEYYLYRTSAPGPVELVDMAPYKSWRKVVISPWAAKN
jgi:hypothetical protein